ncbi:Outer membrane receptor proteins, mostly Fe transport [Draconibacterium orientale]|uniref:Outer membrane receptor proteins, mostly Fe transport n=1 Tax=Draconibacterium orientale TaxID=1168034 RepID=X5DEI5_9BACT|nr:carboxypeptidase-like regulatory domain-containing protein [Draconibacterium orientale]AHW61283.1 TonB-dependent receptor [Draconibacterium orientale]SEU00133.1 Outer membrane receptor proteins, mostly Fe transport [Draconibacterium orientale]
MKNLTTLFLLLLSQMVAVAQSNNATLKGVINDQDGVPIDMVNVVLKEYPTLGTTTNANGEFLLRIPARKQLTIIFSSLGYQTFQDSVYANREETVIKQITMPEINLELAEIIVKEQRRNGGSIVSLDPKIINSISSASGGIEAGLKTLPGVSSNNELSSQYTVRGGNFDENLVYVNDVEVYRPFLIRAGQQEGLSFINSDMVSTIDFSAGGFNAKYGDKMSSVLDIKYRRPSDFSGSASVSMLGATAHFEDVALKGKLSHISGIRYKTNRYILGSLDEQGEYDPRFLDFQTYITYQFNEKFDLSFLGNVAQNQYNFIPQTRETTFGTWQNPLNTKIYFDGQEQDDFQTYLGAITANYHPNANLNLKFIASAYHAQEKETYDIQGQYYLNQLERNLGSEEFGDSTLNLGVGTFINHARNSLDATVYSFSHKGAFNSEKHLVNWGIKFQHEKINDELNEWIYRDSAGYSIPYSDSEVKLFYTLNAKNKISSNRITGYIQDSWSVPTANGDLYLTGGVRFNFWDFNSELLVSPRATLNYFPEWEKKMSFRLSAGWYHQSPFFKELKQSDGYINYDSKAQRSFQVVGGTDLLFTAWDRPFRFTSEAYYKHMNRLIPYQIDNVRIRYLAEEEATGYATGVDFKINGEFVSGLQSWASLSFLQTEEDIKGDGHGMIPRPTDQWMNFSLFFQDYLPGNPTYKMQLSGFYGARLPTGPPNGERYQDVFRMPPYRRIDLGLSKVFISRANRSGSPFFRHITDLSLSLEVFNLLDINNTISYFWVSSIYGDQYAVPNYLTSRKFNLKLTVKF